MAGFIKLHRQITEWEWYDDANTFRLFIHCLLEANYADKQWRGVVIQRGSFITSQPKLANRLKLSVRQVRTSLNKLKMTGELTVKTTADYSVITVKNYEMYQQDDRLTDSLATGYRQANDSLATTTKEYKEIKNEKNIISLCEKNEKKLDPYINPIKDFFIKEYKKAFGVKVYLSNQDCNRIVELAADNSDIKELIPVAFQRLKKINFEDINFKPTASWLLKGNNFERVMNGEFEKQKSQAELYRERRERCENS